MMKLLDFLEEVDEKNPRGWTITMKTPKKKFQGAKEWGTPRNICKGCSHNCPYCYARAAAHRFGWKDAPWAEMELVPEKIQKPVGKAKQRIMFPTSHDITPEIINAACYYLKKLLLAGNEVLIVTKGNRECVARLIEVAKDFKDKVEFRFTITTFDKALAQKYEPGAPSPEERYLAMLDAHIAGFKVSVSIEPWLSNPVVTVTKVYSLADSIWVGPMNNVLLKSTPALKKLYTRNYMRSVHRRLTLIDQGYGRIHFKEDWPSSIYEE
jgi:DNA repair photolyase